MPTDLELVRQVLARELDTINQYEQAAREAESELIRAFFRHLADEEKEHVAEAIQLLHQMDAVQRARFSSADVRLEHFGGETSVKQAEIPRHSFTVGSLKRRKDTP